MDDIDNATDFPLYMRVPANDEPIDIISIIDFYFEIVNIGRQKVTKK